MRKSGSSLLLAIIFTTVLTTVAGGIIARVMHERTLAQQSLEHASLLYLAEGYIEKAMWAVNNEDWTGWEVFNDDGEDRYMPFTRVELGEQEAHVHALVIDAADSPTIYAEARAAPGDGRSLKRQVRIQYDVRSEVIDDGGGGAPGGLIFQNTISMGGQAMIDGYDSSLGPHNFLTNRNDGVTVATTSTAANAFSVNGQVDIYGYAGTGREDPVFLISGPNNKLYGPDTDPGINWDWRRTYGDFAYDFPPIDEPDWSGAINGISYRNNRTTVIGTPGAATPTKYVDTSLKMSGNSRTVLQVAGPVQIYLSDGLTTTGQAYIEIIDGGSLELYSPNDIKIAGQGVINRTQQPINFKIYGTNTNIGGQSLDLTGQGDIYVVLYAPKANVKIAGQGDFYGSAAGHSLTQSGQGAIHYDTSLGGGDSNPGEETIVTIGDITNWHDTTSVIYNFDIEGYVIENGGTYHVPL